MAPTAAVKSINVTNASAAYHSRLYFTPELLRADGDGPKAERGKQIKSGGKEDPARTRRSKGN